MNHSQHFSLIYHLLDGGKDANLIEGIEFLFVSQSLDFDLLESILVSVTFPGHKEHFTVGTRTYIILLVLLMFTINYSYEL